MRYLLVAVFLSIAALPAAARVDNFLLLDQHGSAHELYYQKDAAAVVIASFATQCAADRVWAKDYAALANEAGAKQSVQVLLIDSTLRQTREQIAAAGATVPILHDEAQLVGASLGFAHTGEAVVLDPKTWDVRYRGPVSGVAAALKAVSSGAVAADAPATAAPGNASANASAAPSGCAIAFAPLDGSQISYAKDIAPILEKHCVACHRPGGVGPWAMTSYDMVKGFSLMMKEVIRTDRMPPWHADPHIGTWQADRSLSIDEQRTLIGWIEAGAARGEGEDPLAASVTPAPEWPLGKPDLIVTLPAFTVPASGVVDYQFPHVMNPLDRDVWVRGATVVAGDGAVVHHVLAGSVEDLKRADRMDAVFDNYIMGYAPGAESSVAPLDTGVLVKKGGAFVFQLHYTPVGKEATDVTRLGLYFYDKPPTYVMRHQVVLDQSLQIPPNDPAHTEQAYLLFDRDALLYSLFPHAHYRGRSSSFALRYPDGREVTLLSLPKYDFNWQREYAFTEPLQVPAGAKLIHRTVFDNSSNNPANPDPSRTVPWGLQSWDEMLYGAVVYRWLDETSAKPTHDARKMGLRQMYGFMDKDMDGRLQREELQGRMKERMAPMFDMIDANGDGGIDIDEFIMVSRPRVGNAGR